MIEATIYTRLKDFAALNAVVGNRIYPTTPTEDTDTPFVVYTITGSEPQVHTQGVSNLSRYTLDVDAWAINLEDTLEALDATRQALHGYRGGSVQGSFLTSQQTQPEEAGFHGTQSFNVWALAG